MVSGVYADMGEAALTIATAIKNGDGATVQKMSVAELNNNFAATAYVVRTTGDAVAGDTLKVTQRYELDANSLAPGATSADFSCPLTGSASEVDFSIAGLTKGLYGFVMVEATGERPWLLSMLLRQDGGAWKMAGLYPHARSAAGHDGEWYWKDARSRSKAGQPWLAWLEYGLADALLSPAAFMSSTGLEKLRSERQDAAPAPLRDGLSADKPLVVKGVGDAVFSITALAADGSEDGKRMNLVVRYKADPLSDLVAAKARNLAAVKALLQSFPELKGGFDGALVVAESPGASPFSTLFAKTEFEAGS